MEGSSWQSAEGHWDDNEPEPRICTYNDPSAGYAMLCLGPSRTPFNEVPRMRTHRRESDVEGEVPCGHSLT